ncbi:hypothetical protein SLE2022_308660 [Rubroshorea leprosula]
MVIKEREAAQKAIEEANTQETAKQQLQALLDANKQTAEEAKQAYTRAQAKNGELTKKLNEEEKKAKLALAKNGELTKRLKEEEKKAKQLQDSVHSLEEMFSKSETENQKLRQQIIQVPGFVKFIMDVILASTRKILGSGEEEN